MKVSIPWLKQLVKLNISDKELINILPLRSISIKEVTDNSIELDMKGYNRADLLSLRGVATEIAAITGSQISFDNTNAALPTNVFTGNVSVENPDLAPLYIIAKIEGLTVASSNNETVKKLSDSGIRTINNVADITNLIMVEYGQPMHAFDAKTVRNEAIIVRLAKKDEQITTLDGKTRNLEDSNLLITDSHNILVIAGVMGGKDSEITDSTNTILLEAAIFNSANIRNTAQQLGLKSEASKRFQHGLSKKRLLQALSAAIKLYEGIGGKLTALTIIGDTEDPVKKVVLTQEKINSLIGVDIKPEDVETYLTKLGFQLNSQEQSIGIWKVTVPYWRLDINIEEDLIEEVARMYGYEKIPSTELKGEMPQKIDQSFFELIRNFKNKAVGLGLTEVQTYSFYSTNILQNIASVNLVKIANPISTETEYLRSSIWPNLLEVVNKNIRNGYKDIAIFEIGKTYYTNQDGQPEENYSLSIALMNNTDNPLAELYQIAESLCLHLSGIKLKRGETSEKDKRLFHPNRFMVAEKNQKVVGNLAEVHLCTLNKLGIEKRVAIFEINF